MSDNEIVYRLYLDGLDAKQTLVITKQLEMVNRIGKTTNSLTGTWIVADDRSRADAMYLKEGHQVGDLESIGMPVLTDADIPRGYLLSNVIAISHPHTAVLLASWLEQAEEMMAKLAKTRGGTAPGAATAPASASGTVPPQAQTRPVQASASAGTAMAPSSGPATAGAPGNGGAAAPTPTGRAFPRNEELARENRTNGEPPRGQGERPKGETAPPKQIPFTHIIRDAKNDLLLSWDDAKVVYSASKRKFFTDLGTAVDVVERVFRQEPLITISDKAPDETLPFITYDSLMWSYGLRAEPSRVFVKNASFEKNKFKLSKWPLFGQWETQSKLLLISALFTQKFSSVPEVVHKTDCTREQIVRFLYAAYLSNIPIDREALTAEDHEMIRDLKPEDEHKIKSIAWIDQLRAKLRMQDFL